MADRCSEQRSGTAGAGFRPAGVQAGGDPTMVDLLATMLRIRMFELKINELFARGLVRGTAHLCVGQEAVPTGVCAALGPGDWVSATHRGHGAALAKGLQPYELFAEILGRRDGYCAGRGGSQHIADLSRRFLGTNGISGGGLPIATGAALASRYQGLSDVTIAFFGDGVANQGTFHESLNMAAIWRLPIVFVCENNLYAMSAPAAEFVAGGTIAGRAAAYGIPFATVDGNDVMMVWSCAAKMVDGARSGQGPAMMECQTYRQLGHSKSDQRTYRTRAEESDWEKKDPIHRLRQLIMECVLRSANDIEALEREIAMQIDDAADRAMACEPVADDSLYEFLYAGVDR